jgi:hypothetical protein
MLAIYIKVRRLVVIILIITLFGTINVTLAWFSHSKIMSSDLDSASVDFIIVGDLEDRFKPKDITVENIGFMAIYVRVAIAINWVDASGGIVYPETIDENQLLLGNDWIKGMDGYYYYKYPIAPSSTASKIIDIYIIENNKEDLLPEMVFALSAIQSNPVVAVEEAWGVTVESDNTLQVN